ncbi:MAG TPA: hypothetical protein DCE52_14865 [Rhodobacteraceae bacterium]|nr:hypothetical protein [Paracoccaceae bacterium]
MIMLDFDGTLVDCRQRQATVLNHILKKLEDKELDENYMWQMKRAGNTNIQILKKLKYPEKTIKSLRRLWQIEIEAENWLNLDQCFPWSYEFLEFASQKTTISLLTARQNEVALFRQLEKLQLTKYFKDIFVVRPETAAKSKSEILRSNGAELMCGDTETDAKASMLSETDFYAVSCGQRSHKFLSSIKCNNIYPNILSLKKHL